MINNNNNNDYDKSIFLDHPNSYGFKLNINHPKINQLYRRYKQWKGLPLQYPVSDEQRIEFENYILTCMKEKKMHDIPPVEEKNSV